MKKRFKSLRRFTIFLALSYLLVVGGAGPKSVAADSQAPLPTIPEEFSPTLPDFDPLPLGNFWAG